ncbi:MAG: branched-chain amino acid ABC transporter permease [Thermodesulfobacteriota bacterium]
MRSYRKLLFSAGLFLILALFPLLVNNDYYQHLLILVFMWVVLGSAWNLLGGYTGQVSFGHAVFFGVGAYTAGLLYLKLDLSPWWGMAFGGLAACIYGIPLGLLCFRLKGPYFALAMLALAEVTRLVANNWVSFTEGMVGILIIPTFVSKLPYYYLSLILAAASILTVSLVMKSRLGFYFLSIREDQDAAESIGIPTTAYKMIALMLSAFFTGTAGAFYMNYMGFIDPEVVFSLPHISIMIIMVVIIGGVATIWGSALGAAIMVLLSEVFRTLLGTAHVLSFGIIVVIIIIFLPNGLMGEKERFKKLILFNL